MKLFNRRLEKLEKDREQTNPYRGASVFVVRTRERAREIEKRIKKKYGDVKGLKFIINDGPKLD